MWIVDDDGDMFNTDHFRRIVFVNNTIVMFRDQGESIVDAIYEIDNEDKEERLDRYYDLMKKLTGERPDE